MRNFLILLLLTIVSLSSFGATPRVLHGDQVDGQRQQKNYLKTFDGEKNSNGWTCTGTGTVSKVSTTPKIGTGSLQFNLPAVNDSCYFSFSIDSGDLATVLRTTFKFYQITTVGIYANGEFVIDITDGSGVAIESKIQPNEIYANSFMTDQPYGEWQTQPANLNYRFYIKRAVASSTSTMKVDSLFLGQATKISGPVVTDAKSYTSILTAATTNPAKGTVVLEKSTYAIVGDSVEITYSLYGQSGNAGSGIYFFSIPSGMTIDTSKVVASVNNNVAGAVGTGDGYNGSSAYIAKVYAYDATHLSMAIVSDTVTWATLGSANSGMNASNYMINFKAKIPILGLSSNQVLSEDVGSRKLSAFATTATGTISGSPNIVKFTNIITNDAVAYSASTGFYTVQESGDYDISSQISIDGTYAVNGYAVASLYISGVERVRGTAIAGGSQSYLPVRMDAQAVRLVAGDTIGIYSFSSGTSPAWNSAGVQHWLSISKRSSPQQIAASEKVYAEYNSSAGQTINAAETIIDFGTKVTDTHNAVTTGAAWKFTAPRAGYYTQCHGIQTVGVVLSTIERILTLVRINGSHSKTISRASGNGASISPSIGGCSKHYLLRGSYIDIIARSSVAVAITSDPVYDWITIESN